MSEEHEGCLGMVIGFVMTAIIFGIGMSNCTVSKRAYDEARAKAVELGAAEWVVDPRDGTTTFKWRDETNKPK